jgi:STE24 endopeptidase
VLLSDTLLAQYPPEEVEVVLAHEVGHHRGHHLGLLIACSAFFVGLSCAAVDRWVRAQFGLHGLEGRQDPVTLLAIGWGFSVIQLALLPALNGISRLLEAQADRFALTTTHNPTAFIEAMRRLAKQNLAEVDPPRWVEWLFYDHPPIAKRIAFAQEFFPMQEKEGKRKDAERLHLL